MEARQDGNGVRVMQVVPEGPAAKAGLVPGDVVLSVQDRAVSSPGDVTGLIAEHQPGAELSVRVLRGGRLMTLRITLSARPQTI
jgi:serine protease DegS